MIYLALGVGFLLALLGLARIFVSADPAKLGRFITWFLGALAIGGALATLALLILSERFWPVFIAVASFSPIAIRLWRQWRARRGTAGGRQSSKVETATLGMRLDHATGEMTGTVKRGPYAGRRLDELAEAELFDLLRQCRVEDEDAARLLEAWLDRARPDWRQRAGGAGGGNSGASSGDAMTRDEAYEILGLKPGATAADIRDAHRRLMKKLHPDQGGSNYLAAKTNRAKEILLDA